MTLYKWSQTAASNASIDATINFAEAQAPSSVNDSARALMAAVAKYRDDQSGNILTTGTSTAYAVTTAQGLTTLTDGFRVSARMHTTNGAAPTLNVDALGAKPIRVYTSTAIPTGAFLGGSVQSFTYDSSDDCWYASGFYVTTLLPLTGLQITEATALTAPAIDDELPIYDLSATANRKITLANFFKALTLLTAETSPAIDDELALYDLSATTTDKITLQNLLKVVNALTEDTDPDEGADFLLSYDTSASLPKKVKPYNMIVPGALIALIEDNQAQGVDGATLSAGADRTRTLNTLVYNRNSLVSLSSNRFTLPAGTWHIEWWAGIGANETAHQSFLYNVTDATEVKRGSSGHVGTGSSGTGERSSESFGGTVVVLAGSKAFEIRHRVGFSNNVGQSSNFGTEVYTRVEIYAA